MNFGFYVKYVLENIHLRLVGMQYSFEIVRILVYARNTKQIQSKLLSNERARVCGIHPFHSIQFSAGESMCNKSDFINSSAMVRVIRVEFHHNGYGQPKQESTTAT